MSDVAIRVEGIGKRYSIGSSRAAYQTLRESLTVAFTTPIRRAARLLGGQVYGAADLTEEIWALHDVSFEVKAGEVVGIIGRNGAGKSTLLKILARITEPTEGIVDIYGRVGSLLEVGTGFHPELTGRENVYLNGAILGMKRIEIERKFDEMVAFAEMEKFIDTPVKYYSSGMGLRLGFAVAAHLEPEILIVDEVLAVGDASFQKKCLGKMNDVSQQGRTVLFVSHNMMAIRDLCTKTIVLHKGTLSYFNRTEAAIEHYLHSETHLPVHGLVQLWDSPNRRQGCIPVIRSLKMVDNKGKASSTARIGHPLRIEIDLDPSDNSYDDCSIGIGLLDMYGQLIVPFRSSIQYTNSWKLDKPMPVAVVWDECIITPGIYTLTVAFANRGKTVDWVDEAMDIQVELSSEHFLSDKKADIGGIIVPNVSWHVDFESE